MQQTYDPIVSDWDPPRIRFGGLPTPRLGTTLVLVSGRGDLVRVDPGRSVPGTRTGHYRAAYVIDTTEHGLAIPAQLPSSDSAYVFQAVLQCRCRVADPEQVAQRQLRDAGALIRTSALPRLRAVSGRYDIADRTAAEGALAEALGKVLFDSAFKVTGEYVELPVHADEASASRALREAVRRERVIAVSSVPLRQAIASGVPGVLARHLATNPGDTAEAIDLLAGGELVEGEQMLRAISIMVGAASKDAEAFETWDARKSLMERFVTRVSSGRGFAADRGLPGGTAHREGLGASRVLGTRLSRRDDAAAASARAISDGDDRTVLEGSVIEPGAEPESEPARSSRVVLPKTAGAWPAPKRNPPVRPALRDPDLDERE